MLCNPMMRVHCKFANDLGDKVPHRGSSEVKQDKITSGGNRLEMKEEKKTFMEIEQWFSGLHEPGWL